MQLDEKKNRDDPQIHLLAGKYCNQIRNIYNNRPEEFSEREIRILTGCIRFFAHYIKYLPECNFDVINMCRLYTIMVGKSSSEVDLVDVNRIIAICTRMLIRRKEDDVIRAISFVLKDVLKIVPKSMLESIVYKYSKTVSYIFQKLYLVQTYYTQQCILEIFIFITNGLEVFRDGLIRKNQLILKIDNTTLETILTTLQRIDLDNSINTSRHFLKFFNNNVFTKTCILSVESRITKVNDFPVGLSKNIITAFNGRNLSISFYIPRKYLDEKYIGIKSQALETQKSTQHPDNDLIFVEFGNHSIHAEKKTHNNKNYIDIDVVVSHAQTYDNSKTLVNLDEVNTLSLRLIDNEYVLDKFMNYFYDKFKTQEPMVNDNPSIIDKESIMTFQTTPSLTEDLKIFKQENPSVSHVQNHTVDNSTIIEQNNAIKDHKDGDVKKPSIKEHFQQSRPKKVSKPRTPSIKSSESNVSKRPKRACTTKKRFEIKDIYDEENMSDYGTVVTSYREFKSQKKQEVPPPSKTKEVKSENHYKLSPVKEINTKTTKRSKETKKNTKIIRKGEKSVHFETDNEIDENVKCRKGRKKNTNNKLEQIKNGLNIGRKKEPEADDKFDALKKDSLHISEQSALKSYNMPESPKYETLLKKENIMKHNQNKKLNSSLSDYVLSDVQDIDEKQISHSNIQQSQSFISKRREIIENKPHNDELYASGKSGVKIESINKTAKVIQEPSNLKRKISFDDLKDIPEINKKSRVEKWLKSSSDSFNCVNTYQPGPSKTTQMTTQKEAKKAPNYKPKNTQVEDDDNISDITVGIYEHDDHQNYSSTDEDEKEEVKNKSKIICSENCNTRELISQKCSVLNGDDNLNMNPYQIFDRRSKEEAKKLIQCRNKVADNEKQSSLKYDRSILQAGQKYIEQTRKTKSQLKIVIQLHSQYQRAKLKLINDLNEQEKVFDKFKQEICKNCQTSEEKDQVLKKELINFKNEAIRKNNELINVVWREYIGSLESSFNNAVKTAYEI